MKKQSLLILCAATLLMVAAPTRAQVSNDNEDGVYKVDNIEARHSRFVPGQVIIKFKDESPVTVKRAQGRFVSASRSGVNAVLSRFGVETMDRLFPEAVHKPKAALRRVKTPNGSFITESNVDQVFRIQLSSLRADSTLRLVAALDSLDEVAYAEPNYIAYIMGGPSTALPIDRNTPPVTPSMRSSLPRRRPLPSSAPILPATHCSPSSTGSPTRDCPNCGRSPSSTRSGPSSPSSTPVSTSPTPT